MITEVADFTVSPNDHEAFGQAITRAVNEVLTTARGYRGHEIIASHETRGRLLLLVRWDTVEDHMVGFRESPAFAQWRAIIGPFFTQPPRVEHFDTVAASDR